MENLIISILGSLVVAFFVLFIDRQRLPRLNISAGFNYNSDNTYPAGHPYQGRWKFFRLSIENKKLPWGLRWLTRQTAINCHANLYIYKDEELLFSMKGRWANTPEIPHLPDQALVKMLYPDPVSILIGEKEILDVFVQSVIDQNVYGWNNEAYFNKWKTPAYQLVPGEYSLKVEIITQNGVNKQEKFSVIVDSDIDNTKII
ncbi:MAG: hypothetical protein A2Y82_04105 [Candidatus Buchananbacteria bacterium RBG_13_36_9]|uniref:Uncharacterized protein n=1 Tax=Candidatus Buchananbacteria bacterium RBG_13_36_9 TaxID=1797530 RepID=A0A1G1XSC2_9BACT|nr:MAG: hypothetical protein A2Y82_04105 [Candidatus Buchananbacteria bacterium RBG_13_36_9]